MKLTMDGAGPVLATIDLDEPTPSEFGSSEYDNGELCHTGGNLYIYLDGVEYGSLWFSTNPDGTPRITLGQFDEATQGWEERNPLTRPAMYAKQTILIHAWHTPGGTGGFDWYPTFNEVYRHAAWQQYENDVKLEDFEHLVLVELSLLTPPDLPDPEAPSRVTDYIDAVLLDLIETRQIGRILASHDRGGIHPRITAGLTLEGLTQ